MSNSVLLDYTPETEKAGIAYALALRAKRIFTDRFQNLQDLRQSTADFITKVSLLRYLTEKDILHSTIELSPFAYPGNYEIIVSGRRWCIQTTLYQIKHPFGNTEQLTEIADLAPAVIRVRKTKQKKPLPSDIDIFALLFSTNTPSPKQPNRQVQVYFLPGRRWNPIPVWEQRIFTTTNRSREPLALQIGGLSQNHRHITRTYILPPNKKQILKTPFFAITHLALPRKPDGDLSCHVHPPDLNIRISPASWESPRIGAGFIALQGYCLHRDFTGNARILRKGDYHPHLGKTGEPVWLLPANLRTPLPDLITRTKQWQNNQSSKS